MNDDLLKDIRVDLCKTGFVSEMNALKHFDAAYWRCSGGCGFFDRDENKTREIDISAHLHKQYFLQRDHPFHCQLHAVAEVKKSNKPWVVFRQELIPVRPEDFYGMNLIQTREVPDLSDGLEDAIWNNSLMKVCGWRATGIHQSFKNANNPSRWYPAFVSAVKAAEAELERSKNAPVSCQDGLPFQGLALDSVQPVVILDGSLISASLNKEREIELEEVNAAPFIFDFKTASYNRERYQVDLVTLNWLPEYIKQLQARHEAIFDTVMSAVWNK